MKLLLALLASLSLALVVRGSGLGGFHVETFRHSPDGHHLLLRSKREAQTEVCKYKKGDWSQCDSLVMVNNILYTEKFSLHRHQLSWREEMSSNLG